ncbi:1761_t:CDS:2 [Cetraspora pellucida]|uniref:1761_t:CDS:1 n=1 Tax=Cetraspora pellucida TaxID=1433469 RepID=A0ACA9KVQ6_9GLOM|nr:1761_t:CDS:2 [Cetraspora pellucida]
MPKHKSPRYAANRRYYEKNRERILERRKKSRARWKFFEDMYEASYIHNENLFNIHPSTLPPVENVYNIQSSGRSNLDSIHPYPIENILNIQSFGFENDAGIYYESVPIENILNIQSFGRGNLDGIHPSTPLNIQSIGCGNDVGIYYESPVPIENILNIQSFGRGNDDVIGKRPVYRIARTLVPRIRYISWARSNLVPRCFTW